MTIVAISLLEENLQKIRSTESISEEHLTERFEKFGPQGIHHMVYGTYYFIPQGGMIDGGGKTYDTWTFICQELFLEKWRVSDMSKIDTEFVEITRK